MKRFVKLIAVVLAVCVLGAILVACTPKAAKSAAELAWAKCNRDNADLRECVNVHLDSVEFTSYKLDSGEKAYMFKFVCTYTLKGVTVTNKDYYYKAIETGKNSYSVSYAYYGADAVKKYNTFVKDKKPAKMKDSEVDAVAAYYEGNKAAIVAQEEADRLAQEEAARKALEEAEGEED